MPSTFCSADPAQRLDGSTAVNGARLSYGPFYFPAATQIEFRVEPIYDDSRRFVVGQRLKLKTTFLFLGQDNAGLVGAIETTRGDSLHYVLAILRSPRLPLIIKGLPYGDWIIYPGKTFNNTRPEETIVAGLTNADATKRIYENGNGPLPINDIGVQTLNQDAKVITWEVEANLPPLCVEKSGNTILYFPYGKGVDVYPVDVPENLTYSVNIQHTNGYLTRTISGSLKLVSHYVRNQTRSPLGANRDITKSYFDDRALYAQSEVDRLFPLLDGYKRSYPALSESPDKLTLLFTVTDEEIQSDNPYEVGCSMLSAPYSIQATDASFYNWRVNLDVDLEVAPNYPKTWGYYVFVRIFYDLVKRATLKVTKVPNPAPTSGGTGGASTVQATPKERDYLETESLEPQAGKPYVRLTSLGLREDRYTRKMQFSASWEIVNLDLDNLLVATGFGQPANTGATWERWHASLKNSVHRAIGYSPLGEPIDYYVNFCAPVKATSAVPAVPAANNTGTLPKQLPFASITLNEGEDGYQKSLNGVSRPVQEDNSGAAAPPSLAANEGYLYFKNSVDIRKGTAFIGNYVLDDSQTDKPQDWGGADSIGTPGFNPLSGGNVVTNGVTYLRSLSGKTDKPPQYYVTMKGFILRHTLPPVVPTLLSVGGADAILLNETVTPYNSTSQTPEGRTVTVYGYAYAKSYVLEGTPSSSVVESSHIINPSATL